MSTPPADSPGFDHKRATVRHDLLTWFSRNRRDLPWRHTRDPYRILVSEVMLQQTQVDRVIPYYHAFLDAFPDVHALAAAPVGDVIRLWSGLGYNRRAVNLQRTAAYVVESCGGMFPSTVDDLIKLPGIGPYTAGAIAAFAYEQDAGFIDTNMRRVIHRLFFGVDLPAPLANDRTILELARQLVPPGRGWEWNQALIEFGALHCTARKPLCVVCPLQAECAAFPAIQSAIAALPLGSARKKEEAFTGSNRYYRGRIVEILRQHPAEGIGLQDLGPQVKADFEPSNLPWLHQVVKGLERDGLLRVAEERPAYDTDHDSLASLTVLLP